MIKVVLSAWLLLAQLAYGCGKASFPVGTPGNGVVTAPPKDTTVRQDSTAHPDSTTGPMQTYLALGDSYTIGQSVSVSARYPVQTVAMLRVMGHSVAEPEIIATTGWTTQDLLNALQNTPPSRKVYSRVTLLIGVNNQFQSLPLSQYQTQFTQLLQQSIQLAGDTLSHVIVISIPDYGDSFYGQSQSDPAAITQGIETFNAANLSISQQFGVQYVNITDLTEQAKGDTSLFASDGLHYSGKEMALWAARLVKVW
jgi:lysophospholipase L1-like esterase